MGGIRNQTRKMEYRGIRTGRGFFGKIRLGGVVGVIGLDPLSKLQKRFFFGGGQREKKIMWEKP